jgi:hypothetical protein
MTTTPLWVPLVVAVLAVLGTLAGVVFTQVWNSRLEERRWTRENDRLREARAREDRNRTYEHRRAAYVDFLQEVERLRGIYISSGRDPIDPPSLHDPAFKALADRSSAVQVYGTDEARRLASDCEVAVRLAAVYPDDRDRYEAFFQAWAEYVTQIREDLGVPDEGLGEDPDA